MVKGPKISVLTGNFGSGKTELAINMALKAAKEGKKVVLVDLDIVNPFFRTAEVKPYLEEQGIQVIVPNFATTNMDIPSLPATIYSVFNMEDTYVFFDVGGDEDGAIGLGQYKPYFDKCDYRMYFVINTRRPFTRHSEDIQELMTRVENRSRLHITDLVNNTNLSYETTPEVVLEGQKIIEHVAQETNLPITYISTKKDVGEGLPKAFSEKLLTLELFMQPKF